MLTKLVLAASLIATPALANGLSIIVQSTTSTANSGLYDHLLPMVKQDTGVSAHVVAVGTGQAIRNAQNCDADVLLVHAKSAEETFVSEGYGVERFDLMYNDFVLVGPSGDPNGIKDLSVTDALKKLASDEALFASRGDDSGTHKKERALWEAAGIDAAAASGTWYRETGSGMGATLNVAVGMSAVTMTDRATWISFKNKSDFTILVERDEALFNQYGVIRVNPDRCPNAEAEAGQAFIDWLLSEKGQAAIGAYTLDGKRLFFPTAKR